MSRTDLPHQSDLGVAHLLRATSGLPLDAFLRSPNGIQNFIFGSRPTDATRCRRRGSFDSSHESVQFDHRSTRPVPSRSAPCIFPGLPSGPSIRLINSSPTCRFRNSEVRFPNSRSADPISSYPSTLSPHVKPDCSRKRCPLFRARKSARLTGR